MPFEHIVTHQVTIENRRVSKSVTVAAGQKVSVNEEIDATPDDQMIVFALDVSEVKSFFICASVDVTVYTNDEHDGSPDQSIALKAGIPYVWHTDYYDAFKLTTDVTALYLYGSGEAGVLEIEALVDPTP